MRVNPLTVVALAVALTGCQAILNNRYPPGEMGPDGKVYPCNDRRINHQGCGDALYNAPRVRKLTLGQSIAEARSIMGRDPEQRSIKSTADGKPVEQWSFRTQYDKSDGSSVFSFVTFTDGRITAVDEVRQAE